MSNKIRGNYTSDGKNGGEVTVSQNGNKTTLDVNAPNLLSTVNSSTTPLGIGANFTGAAELNSYDHVGVQIETDADGTLFFEFSVDGTNWIDFPANGYRVAANTYEQHFAVKMGRYFRVRLENDGTAQTYLRLSTYYGMNFIPASIPTNETLDVDADSTSTRPTNFGDEVLLGRRRGVSHFTKFGYRDNLQAANGEETIWATTGNFTPMTTASTFTITYTPASDGSTSNGAKTLYFQYVDTDGLDAIAVHTLGSSGSDVTSFTGLGINRIAVSSSGSTQTNGAIITVTETTGGTTQAVLPALGGVTQQCVFHVDSNSDAVAKFLWLNINKTSGGATPKVKIKAYVFNRAVQTRFEVFRVNVDTSAENTVDISEPVGFKLSPSDVLYFIADTDTNNTEVTLRFSLFEYKRT